MEVEEAIRTRRTHKVYGSEPVPRETLDEQEILEVTGLPPAAPLDAGKVPT